MSKFHERLTQLKNEHKVTQTAMADALGISSQALSYYMNGREPKYDLLVKIASYFNVSIDYLIGISEHPNVAKIENQNDRLNKILSALSTQNQNIVDRFLEKLEKFVSLESSNNDTQLLKDAFLEVVAVSFDCLYLSASHYIKGNIMESKSWAYTVPAAFNSIFSIVFGEQNFEWSVNFVAPGSKVIANDYPNPTVFKTSQLLSELNKGDINIGGPDGEHNEP